MTGGRAKRGVAIIVVEEWANCNKSWRCVSESSVKNNVRTPNIFRSISGNIQTTVFCFGKMSAQRKRSLKESSVIDLDAPANQEMFCTEVNVEMWIVENDKELNTSIWLKFETAADDRDRVATLKCAVCS